MIETLATLLMNKTCMERFNKAEVESVLNFLMVGGYLVDPKVPEVVTVPRAELETVEGPSAETITEEAAWGL